MAKHRFKKEMIIVGNDGIRAEWLSHYQQVNRKLFKLKHDWNQFEKEAHDLFRNWYHSTFATFLNDIKQSEEESEKTRLILSAIKAQTAVNQLTKREAYEKVMFAIRSHSDPFPSSDEEANFKRIKNEIFLQQFQEGLKSKSLDDLDLETLEQAKESVLNRARGHFERARNTHEANQIQTAINNAIQILYDSLMKLKHKAQKENAAPDPSVWDRIASAREERRERNSYSNPDGDRHDVEFGETSEGDLPREKDPARITVVPEYKMLYRKIVRLLHPDRGSEMTEQEKDLWSKAQEAYRLQEVESLRVILLRIEGGGQIQINSIESIGKIRDLVLSLHQEYTEISYHQSRVKKEAVYRFWASRKRPGNREKLRLEILRGLQNQLFYQTRILKELSTDLKRLERNL